MQLYFSIALSLFIAFFSFGQEKKIDSLIHIFEKLDSDSRKLNLLEELNPLIIDYPIDNSIYYFNKMVEISIKDDKPELEAMGYRCLSEYYLKMGDYLNSKKYGEKSIIDVNAKTYLLGINQLGRVYDHFREFEKALEIFEKGVKYDIEEKKDTLKIKGIIYSNLGNTYADIGNSQKQIEMYLNAIDFAEKINDLDRLSYTQYVIGWSYMNLTQNQKAEKFFLQSLKDTLLINQKYKYYTYHALGILYSRDSIFDKALKYNKKALEYFEQTKNRFYELDVLNNMSILYLRMKNYELASDYAQRTLILSKELNHKFLESAAKQTLITIYISKERYREAKQLLWEISKDTINDQIIDLDTKTNIYQYWSLVYEKEDDYLNALKFYKAFKKNSDSLLNKKLNSKFGDIETKYQTEKKEKENLQLKTEKTEQELLTQKANTKIRVIFLLLLTATIAGFLIWRRYKAETKAKQIISIQKDEIEQQKNMVETLQKELHHRMKNNLSFIDLFINLAKAKFSDKAYQDKLNDLQNRIHSMFDVHKQLFKKNDLTLVQAKYYIDKLVGNIKYSYLKSNVTIINSTNENETLLANSSFPIGLIVNEFVTNSFKHAFNDSKNGIIEISLTSDRDNYVLNLKDNGKGLPKNFDINSQDSFGMEAILLLVKEYNGRFDIDGSNGVILKISLPKLKSQ